MESFNYNERGKCRKFSLSHRLQQLEENFKASGGKFIKCKLEKLFKIKGNPQLNKESFTFSEKGIYPYFTRTVFNNGILGYVDYLDDEHKISGNTIAVGMLGMQFFYMEKDFYAGQFTKTLYPKISKFNESIALYFIGMLNKLQSLFQGVLVRDFEKTFYNTEIVIPQRNNQIDFAYMEKRIRVLEEERIRVLEAYLKVIGLDKYILTKEEQEAYDTIHNGEGRFRLYTIKSIFNIRNTHSILQSSVRADSGSYPYVTASDNNNAVSTYISYDKNYLEEGNSIMIGGKTLVITYQKEDYFSNDSHNLALYLKQDEMRTESKQLFLVSALLKTLKPRYSWGDSISHKKIQDDYIMLPVNQNDEIDYELMETYIRAIEKKVIKNVVDWKDAVIAKTKEVVKQ